MNEDLKRLIAESRARVAAMTPEEVDTMVRRQIEGVAKAEASRPKPDYRWENGVKVYASYGDYCDD